MDKIKKILIVNPFGIGDVLFTTPFLSALKKAKSDLSISYWCNERVRPILAANPNLDKIFALSRGDLKKIFIKSKRKGIKAFFNLLGQLRKGKFDLAFDFSLDHRYSLLLRLLRVKKVIGFDYKNRGRFLTQKVKIDGYEGKHVAEYYLDMLKFLDIDIPEKPKTELFVSPQDESFAESYLKQHNAQNSNLLIGIAPAGGASWAINADYLRWPEEKFTSLIEMLIKVHNATILLLGAADEADICQRIESFAKGRIINAAGKTDIGQFAALLSKCKLAICNDAGPLHTAVALGIKTISICGPVDERVYAQFPIDSNNRIVKNDIPCRPCYRKFKMPPCPRNKECLNGLSVDEVYSCVKELIQ